MNRIVLIGDTHGVLETGKIFNYQESKSKLDENDYLIICGDCGVLWGSDTKEESIKHFASFGTNILFVDGNHENFDMLNAYPVEMWNGGKVHKLASNVIHLMRGQVFEICGKKILTLGGGKSTDIELRQEYISWWENEEFDKNDLKEAIKNLKKHNFCVDFVISHSPSDKTIDDVKDIFTQCGEQIPFYIKDKLEYSTTSENLQKIEDKLSFYEWICGHLHIDEVCSKKRVIYNNFYELNRHSKTQHQFAKDMHDFFQELIDGGM